MFIQPCVVTQRQQTLLAEIRSLVRSPSPCDLPATVLRQLVISYIIRLCLTEVTGLSLQSPSHSARVVHMGFVLSKVATG